MQWFRMYAETLDDPKVQRLPADLFKVWVNLLCLAAKHDGALPCVADMAFALRLSDDTMQDAVSRLQFAGLLDEDGPHNWKGRQFKSDVSTDRVKRHRERSGNVSCNVSETPPDTEQTQIQNREEKKVVAPRGSRLPTNWTIPRDWHEWAKAERPDVDSLLEADKFRDFWVAKAGAGGVKLDWLATWRNWIRNASAPRHGKRTDGPSDIEIIADVTRELARQDHGGMG